jgi:hypothetical protein
MGLSILVPCFILNLLVKFSQYQPGHAFGALAHPIRRGIRAPLSTIAELAKPCKIFAPALTKRTRVLEEAGLLSMRNHALDLVQQGVIAFEELREVLTPERLAGN